MENEKNVQGMLEDWVGLIFHFGHLKEHIQKVPGIA
jgi:hypothetical protein